MPSALVVGTNTYVTLAEASTYLDDSISSGEWAFLDEDTQTRALISAFRLLAKQEWGGSKADEDQEPDFPRTGLTCHGEAVASDEVPQDIKDAQIELAYALSQDPTIAGQANTGSNVKRLQAGAASIEFFNSTDGSGGVTAGRFPPNVQELLNCYLAAAQAGPGIESFGTCGESIFDQSWDRNDPF